MTSSLTTASASALRSASVTPSIRVSGTSTASTPPSPAPGAPRPRQTATSRRHALREFYKLAQQSQSDVVSKGSGDRASSSNNNSSSTSNDDNTLNSDLSSSSSQSRAQNLDFTEQEIEQEEEEVSLETLVQTSDLKELLRHENRLALEIRELDSEGKALVYNNYSKLTKASAVLAGIVGVDSSGLGNEAKAAAAAVAAAAAAGDRDPNPNDSNVNDDAILEQTRQWVRLHAAAETRALVTAGDHGRAEELVSKVRTLLASDRFAPTVAAVPWKETILAELTELLSAAPDPEN